ncbi:hypothetical protein HK101_006292 [Irineochytrium annulatum]|nr:hypothetical protein HK101_006292 [Irineochytrium annulatum]
MNNQIYDASVYNAAPHNVQTAPRYESAAQQVPPRPSMVKETSQVTIVSTDGRVSQMQQIADKEKELYSREMQLRYREEKVAERERVVADFDVKAPNWPACRPLVHHNILEDIPAPHQKIVKRMYASWYFSCMTYLVNFFGAFALVGGCL